MTDCSAPVTPRRFAIEPLVAAGVFLFIVAAGDMRFALPGETGLPLGAVVAATHHQASMLLLALVFSLLMALNLAFFCHLFTAYASSPPGSRGRAPWSNPDGCP